MKNFIIGFAATLMLLTGCTGSEQEQTKSGDPEREAPSGSVAASDRQIASVDVFEDTKHASVKTDLQQGWDDSSLPVQVSLVLESAGEAIKAGGSEIPADNATINFWFTSPLTDGTRGKVMEFRVKTDDLRRADYESLPPQHLLEYAYNRQTNFRARAGVAEFCDENRATNPVFCANIKE